MFGASVIIPTFNKEYYLGLTLSGFLLQTRKDFEIIIINDGGNKAETESVIDKYSKSLNIKYIYQENQGRSYSRNRGMEIATGDYIIFSDDDRIPNPEFVSRHLELLSNSPKKVSIGYKQVVFSYYKKQLSVNFQIYHEMIRKNPEIIEKVLKNSEGSLFTSDELIGDFYSTMNKWHFWTPRDNYEDITTVFTDELQGFHLGWILATTGNMAFDRTSSSSLKFDENYTGWGVEDTDFSFQLKMDGNDFVVNREAVNYHQIHSRGATEGKEVERNLLYFMKKFNNPEIALFIRYFKGEINLIDANKIVDSIDRHSNDHLTKDYILLLGKHMNHVGEIPWR
ncbi:glycosyltransferase family 2 protein [Cohnella sp. LGH]|uniref:glycosyltransferase family 2 protein n=1 Tax=Cohnella sp. LGH TaxID=1619153 RepID=UPI001ADBA0CA|nr:glycosyltransferase [Cohnella sp. LGH]QTH41187.1 glycosyltransferase family 2 protein [Cohnella sp. LGH]